MNLLDRVLLPIAPGLVAGRVADRLKAQVLDAAGSNGLPAISASAADSSSGGGSGGGTSSGSVSRWWRPWARDARSDTLSKLPLQRGQSRELVRTNPIAAGAINTNVDRIIGTGLAYVAMPNKKILGWSEDQLQEWKATAQAEFSLWADNSDNCDIAGEQTFYQAQRTVLRGTKESGDIFTLLPNAPRTKMQPYGLRFQLIEADRVGNPSGQFDTNEIAGGIRFGAGGRPLAAHIYEQHPGAGYMLGGGKMFAGAWVDFRGESGRRRLLHHFHKLRPDQPRGVPYLAPVVEAIAQLGKFTKAEIDAAVINSFFTMIIETEGGNTAPVFTGVGPEGGSGDGSQETPMALGMGAVLGLAKGEKASFADPKRPNPNAQGFIEGMLGLIGMALGIPKELLLKQFNASYSASKAALLDAWVYFRNERMWAGLSFCQPVFETWMAEAVAIGRIQAPGFFADPMLRWAYTRAAWPGDSMGSINPKDEIAAYTAAIDARLMTRERAEWEFGGTDFNETFDQKLAEEKRLRDHNMLPVPKAGAAAAPANPTNAPAPAQPTPEPATP